MPCPTGWHADANLRSCHGDPRLKTLVPDVEGSARAWAEQHGDPINHMLVMRSEFSQTRPDLVREVFRIFKASRDIAIAAGNKGAVKLHYGYMEQPRIPAA